MTPRNEVIQIKVDPEEKGRLKTFAKDRHETLSGYVRKAALTFPEYGKTPAAYDERAPIDLEKERKLIEDDPSNLNVTLNEKGSVVKSTTDPVEDERQGWIHKREMQLQGRMSTRAAQLQARQDWDKLS